MSSSCKLVVLGAREVAVVKHNPKLQRCYNCKLSLGVGDEAVLKSVGARARRYCKPCAVRFNIWEDK